MKKYFYSLILLFTLAISGAAQSLNVLTYGADPTGAADSWPAFQKAVDDAGSIGRGWGGSGSAGSNILTINPTTGIDASWYGFVAADAGKQIAIEANLGTSPNQHHLLIDQVLSATQATIKSWNGAALTFNNSFSGAMVIWQRAGAKGRHVKVPAGNYQLYRQLQIVGANVGLVGEWGAHSSIDTGSSINFAHYGIGIVQKPFIDSDKKWFKRGPALVPGATASYRLQPGVSDIFWDYADLPQVEQKLYNAAAFTVEMFWQPLSVAPLGQEILSYSGTLPGAAQERALNFELSVNGTITCRVNIGGTIRNIQSNFIPTVGQTYHLCLQFDGSELRLFVDGVPQQGVTGLLGQKLIARPYEVFALGGWRAGMPGGGAQSNAQDCYVSHLRVSKISRYPMTGFTPVFSVPAIDSNTLLMDEGEPSQEKLFTISMGGLNTAGKYDRGECPRHVFGDWAFNSYNLISGLKISSYGIPLWTRRVVSSAWRDLVLQSNATALVSSGDNFSDTFSNIRLLGVRAGFANSGPGGICTYQDFTVTGGRVGAWLSHGSGVLSNWYVHGNRQYGIVFDLWEGSVFGTQMSNEDTVDGAFESHFVISRDSDLTISGSRFEAYALPKPAMIMIAPRAVTILNGMFEPNAAATECIKFTGAAPKAKVVLINPNHGKYEGIAPQTNVPWSASAPAGKLTVIQ